VAHERVTIVNKGGVIVRIPDPNDASSNLVLVLNVNSQTRQDVLAKLSRTQVGVSYQNATLGDVLLDLTKQAGKFDPDGTRISFVYSGSLPDNVAATEPTAIHINLTLNTRSLAQILDAICAASDYPINYSIGTDAVQFRPIDPAPAKYEMRAFKIDPNLFYSQLLQNVNLSNIPPVGPDGSIAGTTRDVNFLARKFFQNAGVNWSPPKTLFFNDRRGLLDVYATPQDLEVVERSLGVLCELPPQIHIKARFIEVPTTKQPWQICWRRV
jgi:hypothetical protein